MKTAADDVHDFRGVPHYDQSAGIGMQHIFKPNTKNGARRQQLQIPSEITMINIFQLDYPLPYNLNKVIQIIDRQNFQRIAAIGCLPPACRDDGFTIAHFFDLF